ncbi:hypothetical protein [Dethiothermospora halolimnae]|uniref:hypothetical protein n=1 Tax=Dethiothermospora halolimnae TaxID=3114390 RepID=UPI003CCB9B51
MENEKIFNLMEKMYSELSELKSDVKDIKSQTQKNSLALEKIQTDMKTLAEIQSSFSDELDRAKDSEGKTLGERLDIIELAVTDTSKTLISTSNKLNNKLDDLQIDVNNLTAKTVKTDTKVIRFERLLSNSTEKKS